MPCDIKKLEWCDAMAKSFQVASGVGLRLVMLFNTKTGKERHAFVYKRDRKSVPIFLNHCPWCGAFLDPEGLGVSPKMRETLKDLASGKPPKASRHLTRRRS